MHECKKVTFLLQLLLLQALMQPRTVTGDLRTGARAERQPENVGRLATARTMCGRSAGDS